MICHKILLLYSYLQKVDIISNPLDQLIRNAAARQLIATSC
ncbi:MAG: hypothetical protein ACTS73_00625 [Arsenophonus sp. NEOnobi-MAG3]